MGVSFDNGLTTFSAALDKLAALPDSVVSEMLTAGGEVIAEAHRAKLEQYGAVDTGQLRDSVKVQRPNVRAGTVEIKPTGSRKRGNTTTRNEEIGYIVEHGKKGMPGRPWMREGNADAEDKAVDAAGKVLDAYLDKIGL